MGAASATTKEPAPTSETPFLNSQATTGTDMANKHITPISVQEQRFTMDLSTSGPAAVNATTIGAMQRESSTLRTSAFGSPRGSTMRHAAAVPIIQDSTIRY